MRAGITSSDRDLDVDPARIAAHVEPVNQADLVSVQAVQGVAGGTCRRRSSCATRTARWCCHRCVPQPPRAPFVPGAPLHTSKAGHKRSITIADSMPTAADSSRQLRSCNKQTFHTLLCTATCDLSCDKAGCGIKVKPAPLRLQVLNNAEALTLPSTLLRGWRLATARASWHPTS